MARSTLAPAAAICRPLKLSGRSRRGRASHAWHLDVAKALAGTPTLSWCDGGARTAAPEIFGNAVLARRDTPTSYHFAVTVDDAAQGVP